MNRLLRDHARGQAAAKQARTAGADAVTAAVAQINATFSPAIHHNQLKLAVEHIIRLGCCHPEVRARYAGRARAASARTLRDAIVVVECWRLAERRRPGRSPLSLQVLAELRLLLRLMRFRGVAWTFPMVVSALLADDAKIERVA